jgi:hypothetical protein
MYRRAYCFAGLAIAIPALLLANSGSDPVYASSVSYPQVRQVDCDGGKGSAFLTERGWVSVDHVTSLGGCSIDGFPITATKEDGDFSRVTHTTPKGLRGFKVNCEGFIPGRWYHAIGYAGGFSWQSMQRHLATYKKADNGHRMLLGSPTVIPGESGGVYLDEFGAAVGAINAYSLAFPVSFSRELKDTSLCR